MPGAIIAYLIAALIGALWPNGETGGGAGEVTVYLVAGPIHYDFLLPADAETLEAFDFARGHVPLDAPGVDWVVVGWGSRAFYTATGGYSDLSLGTVWRAATGDGSVLHVSVAGDVTGLVDRQLSLTAEEYRALRAAILSTAPDPTPIAGAGFSEWDAFFEAGGRFHLFRTCNVWVAEVLRAAGLRFGRWTPTPYAVTLSRLIHQSS